MTQPPPMTDIAALARNRARASRQATSALFLQEEAAHEIKLRLNEVNRTFTKPVIVTPFADLWQNQLPGARIVFPGETLDLVAGTYDLVIHAMALHWANDPVGQLIQCHRALTPDGLFLGATFGGETLHELRQTLSESEVELTGGLSPRVVPMGEIRDLGALLQRAGFAMPVADSHRLTVTYKSALHLMHDLRAMGETNALAARRKVIPPHALFTQTARRYAARHAALDGRIPATFEIIFLTGWAPDESQPKPLRPGSATARLADALSTTEFSLPKT